MVRRFIYHYSALASALIIAFAFLNGAVATPSSGADWSDWTFSSYKPVTFAHENGEITIDSEQAASLYYRRLSDEEATNPVIEWSWKVDETTTKPTPLHTAPGDDRLISLYVFFSKTPNPFSLLTVSGDFLAYVWGSEHEVNEVVNDPEDKGKSIILRSHDAPLKEWTQERVNYKDDFKRLFGYDGYPVYIAIGADSDDTKGKTIAAIKQMRFTGAPKDEE